MRELGCSTNGFRMSCLELSLIVLVSTATMVLAGLLVALTYHQQKKLLEVSTTKRGECAATFLF